MEKHEKFSNTPSTIPPADPGIVVEMSTLRCTLNKPPEWMGYHGKGTWLNTVAYFN